MPRNESVISVFVASPGDVFEERKALETIVQDLNRTWSRKLKLRLELIKWETDTYPGFGAYPQDVINKQVNDEYDIFIGIFWGRVGTPTNVSESGTVEEFTRAHQKFLSCNDSIDIMIYFKDEPISPSKMDPDQLGKVQAFKKSLFDKGAIHSTFDSLGAFESLLTANLSKVAQKWAKRDLQAEPQEVTALLQGSNDLEDEYGLLDYMDMYESEMLEMTSALGLIGEATERVGDQFRRRTEEMNKLSDASESLDANQSRKIVKLSSNDMDRFSETVESQMKRFIKSRDGSFDVLSKALALYVDFTHEKSDQDLMGLRESLDGLKDAATDSIEGMAMFRTTVLALPRITIQLNKSKRRAVKALDGILEESALTSKYAADIVNTIDGLLKNA